MFSIWMNLLYLMADGYNIAEFAVHATTWGAIGAL
jgi:hypothetical protein